MMEFNEYNLTFDERLLLSLYLEFFGEQYKVTTEKGNKKIVNHGKAQNMTYLFSYFNVPYEYTYMLDNDGVKSPGVESLLMQIDQKKLDVDNFYKQYISVRNEYHSDYLEYLKKSLSIYLNDRTIRKVATTCVLFQNISNKNSDCIAKMLYMARNILPYEEFSVISNEMANRGYIKSIDMQKLIWVYLQSLDLIPMEKPKIKIISK